ncbi:MAG: DUF4468 domain-containing protein [Vicinamibacteria bacterium]|nr:DUF4468 domain-containing protein [Vicinamibacteria bacterium]
MLASLPALLVLAQVATATPAPGPVAIAVTEVVQTEGKSADQLYSAALAWFPTAFKSGKAVLDVQDKAAGKLIGKAVERWEAPALLARTPLSGAVSYLVTIDVKDGRYRYTVGPFVHEPKTPPGYGTVTDDQQAPVSGVASSGSDKKNWTALQKLSRETAASLAESLRAAMAKPPDNW